MLSINKPLTKGNERFTRIALYLSIQSLQMYQFNRSLFIEWPGLQDPIDQKVAIGADLLLFLTELDFQLTFSKN